MEGAAALDDLAIKRGVLAGDASALRALHDRNARSLYAFCFFRLGRDHHATEEVVQETLLRALERIEEFDPERGDLATWLAYLSRNLIRSANQARSRFFAAEVPEPASDPPELGGDAEPAEAEAVAVALARLPARYRELLLRKYDAGETARAIAEAEKTTEKSIESLLARAREAFLKAYLLVHESETEPCP
jgi:RNA polymerase sigma-70 factor (ECF subfamily)